VENCTRVDSVAFCDETEVLGEFQKSPKSHANSQNTGPNRAIIRYLITENRAGGSIHDKPDVTFDATDLDIGFIGSKGIGSFIVVMIHKGLDNNRKDYNGNTKRQKTRKIKEFMLVHGVILLVLSHTIHTIMKQYQK
jgi:hypothetical protein